MRLCGLYLLLLLAIAPPNALASTKFADVTKSDMNGINRDFSALFAHNTVSPPSGLLKEGAFEFGLIAGTVTIPNIARVAARSEPQGTETKMINIGLIGLFSYSSQTTIEGKFLPSVGSRSDGASLSSESLAVKYTFKETKAFPFASAARVHLTNSTMKSDQVINNATTGNTDVDAKTEFNSLSYGIALLAGPKILVMQAAFFEPYIGIGYISSHAKMEIKPETGNASIFTDASGSMSSNVSGGQYFIGAQLHSYFTKLGYEYSRVFDSNRMTFKISFGY